MPVTSSWMWKISLLENTTWQWGYVTRMDELASQKWSLFLCQVQSPFVYVVLINLTFMSHARRTTISSLQLHSWPWGSDCTLSQLSGPNHGSHHLHLFVWQWATGRLWVIVLHILISQCWLLNRWSWARDCTTCRQISTRISCACQNHSNHRKWTVWRSHIDFHFHWLDVLNISNSSDTVCHSSNVEVLRECICCDYQLEMSGTTSSSNKCYLFCWQWPSSIM